MSASGWRLPYEELEEAMRAFGEIGDDGDAVGRFMESRGLDPPSTSRFLIEQAVWSATAADASEIKGFASTIFTTGFLVGILVAERLASAEAKPGGTER